MKQCRVAVIGAGVGGLAAALRLAVLGHDVIVLEKLPSVGGKVRQLAAGPVLVDAGPTVFTMRWVFEQIFAEAGTTLAEHVEATPLACLARHAWSLGERLDLFADIDRSAEAIREFSDRREADGYRAFCARAASIYRTLEAPFIRSSQPTPFSLAMGGGPMGFLGMWQISPFTTLWQSLGDHFRDPRLLQLFGRYATYCGSSPFHSPATLMLVAHVEQEGVWTIKGGMHGLVAAMAQLARDRGVDIRLSSGVESIETSNRGIGAVYLASGERVACDAVVVNADANAVATGLFGEAVAGAVDAMLPSERSLSAITWTMRARTSRFSLRHHNVLFSRNYPAEFQDILDHGRPPTEPTVYICAQDRTDDGDAVPADGERLLVLINAPAAGDRRPFTATEIEECKERTLSILDRCGLDLEAEEGSVTMTTPRDFAALFPATGGALYGRASHGWMASFSRPEARTRIPGLYLAGGSVHPGPGMPMAAISGWLAAESLHADLDSISRFRPVAMPGGMSTR